MIKRIKNLLLSAVLLMCFLSIRCDFYAYAMDTLQVRCIDVGQGLCILVQSGGEVMIYDGGGRDTSSYIVSTLKKLGIEKIDYLIASHYDEDHIAGLIGCIKIFDIGCIMGPSYYEDSSIYQSFCDATNEKDLEIKHPISEDTISIGDAEATVLAPLQQYEGSNDNSIVLKLQCGNTSFLFTGDAEKESEMDMIANNCDLESTVLFVGHHGSRYSTSSVFIEQVSPEYVVISCGAGNKYGHPHSEVMETLRAKEIEVYRTDIQGSISVLSDGNTLYWETSACNDYSSGETVNTAQDVLPETNMEEITEAVTGETDVDDYNYVLNTSRHKIHYPDCNSVAQMSDKNKLFFYGTRDEAIELGYDPCKNCNP